MIIPCEHDLRGCPTCRKTRKRIYNQALYVKNKEKHLLRSREWHQVNRVKKAAHTRNWRKKNPEKVRAQQSRSKMIFPEGVTIAGLFAEQKGCCAVCTRLLEAKFHVDHDHDTGLVRGLLCGNCNRGLGCFRDNVENMRQAAAYLQQHGRPPEPEVDVIWDF